MYAVCISAYDDFCLQEVAWVEHAREVQMSIQSSQDVKVVTMRLDLGVETGRVSQHCTTFWY